jgi:hypothetical protein
MDGSRFDLWTKATLTAGVASRRGLARGLSGAALGAAGVLLGLGDGRIGPRPAAALQSDSRCPKGSVLTNNTTCSGSSCGGQAACNGGGFCTKEASGSRQCVDFSDPIFACPAQNECRRSKHCAPGEVCVKVGGCCPSGERLKRCLPICV